MVNPARFRKICAYGESGIQRLFVPVPIGNRADITLRALNVLRKVDVIACEDTRHSGLLLSHYEIRKPLISMHDHNEQPRAGEIAARAAGGESFAVISDAGMPGVSDPGYRLIQTLKEKGVSFTVLPGPSAVVTALVGSGLPTDAFFFGGFLPVKSGKKRCAPNGSGSFPYQYFYESPHRIVKTVQALAALDPDIPVCVARELTKTFETYHRGPASRLAAEFAERPPRGEIVLLVGGVNAPRAAR